MVQITPDSSVIVRKGRVFRPLFFPLRGRKRAGEWGEWVALRHVRRLGWDVVTRNWRIAQGEVDLIAFDEPFLVFAEVKTRHLPSPLPPEDNIDREKEEKIDQLAFEFLLRYELGNVPVRLDVIAVETPDFRRFVLRHYQG